MRSANSSVMKALPKKQCSLYGTKMLADRVYDLATRAPHAPDQRRCHQGLCGHAGMMSTATALSRSILSKMRGQLCGSRAG